KAANGHHREVVFGNQGGSVLRAGDRQVPAFRGPVGLKPGSESRDSAVERLRTEASAGSPLPWPCLRQGGVQGRLRRLVVSPRTRGNQEPREDDRETGGNADPTAHKR